MDKVVFLSYRRDDTRDATGRIYDWLTEQIGSDHIFRDVDSIPVGVDFRTVLREEVAKCDVVVAVIGDRWLTATTEQGQPRLGNPNDFLRLELESAFERGVAVVIALVDEAVMPIAESLPTSLSQLTSCPVIRIRPDPDFQEDIDCLIGEIRTSPLPHGSRPATRKEAIKRAQSFSLLGSFGGVLIASLGLLGLATIQSAREESLIISVGAIFYFLTPLGVGSMFGGIIGWRRWGILGAVCGVVLVGGTEVSVGLGVTFFWLVISGIISQGENSEAWSVIVGYGINATFAGLAGMIPGRLRDTKAIVTRKQGVHEIPTKKQGASSGFGLGIFLGLAGTFAAMKWGSSSGFAPGEIVSFFVPVTFTAFVLSSLGALGGWLWSPSKG